MNKYQKIIIILLALIIFFMLIFPPFQLKSANLTINKGYAFLFNPPNLATVNIGMLLIQWIAVLLIGTLAFFLAKGQNRRSRDMIDSLEQLKKSSDLENASPQSASFNHNGHSSGWENRFQKFIVGQNSYASRWFARFFDMSVIGGLSQIAIGIISFMFLSQDYILKHEGISIASIFFLSWFILIPIEALFISSMGTTPGKMFLGLRVLASDGKRLTYSAALKRTFLVWIRGCGFGIPIVNLFTWSLAYSRLKKTGTTYWDQSIGSVVHQSKLGVFRVTIIVIALLSISAFISIINRESTSINKTVSAGKENISIEQYLLNASNEINKDLPRMLDNNIRLDTTFAGPGREFTYYFSLMSHNSSEIDQVNFYKEMTRQLRTTACSDKNMALYISNGVTFIFKYRGKDGLFFAEIPIKPKDCGYSQ